MQIKQKISKTHAQIVKNIYQVHTMSFFMYLQVLSRVVTLILSRVVTIKDLSDTQAMKSTRSLECHKLVPITLSRLYASFPSKTDHETVNSEHIGLLPLGNNLNDDTQLQCKYNIIFTNYTNLIVEVLLGQFQNKLGFPTLPTTKAIIQWMVIFDVVRFHMKQPLIDAWWIMIMSLYNIRLISINGQSWGKQKQTGIVLLRSGISSVNMQHNKLQEDCNTSQYNTQAVQNVSRPLGKYGSHNANKVKSATSRK